MTVTFGGLLPYAGALALLAATPGPVVAALIARSTTGGVRAAVPLAAGVAVGDILWPLLAMLGIGVVSGIWADFLLVLRYLGAAILVLMGVQLVRRAEAAALAVAAGALGRESGWAAFGAGLMVIAGNPKAILFYMGVLPGFFDFRRLTPFDMVVICAVSVLVPFLGNLAWAALFARARHWLADPVAMRWTHTVAGLALVAVGIAIAVG
ncbi:MAG TPA: LysE family translocator [Amaricoccus sp.]|nr:LysE family translocator [Amaricoccus sp.]